MSAGRDLRLQADYDAVGSLAHASDGTLTIESVKGKPPDEYVLLFRCRGIEAVVAGKPVYRNEHRVLIRLPAKYPAPSAPPQASVLTPIFHPHVYTNRDVCTGSWRTSDFLDDFVLRLGGLLQYDRRYLNVTDPANVAAQEWAQKNLLLFPTDTCTFFGDQQAETPAVEASTSPTGWIDIEDLGG